MRSALEIAADISSGRLSPVDHMAETLERMAALDPLVHAVIAVDAAGAMAQARRRQQDILDGSSLGPLHGVPFAVKDMIDVRGLPTTCQSRVHPGEVAIRDAPAVERLRRAGAIPVGKLALEEFGIGSDDDEGAWPSARNPWDPARTPGGSSGGCAAAVAAGLVPLAIGTDTGGSVRCPAAMCGVVGLKPTDGRIDKAGVFPLAPSLDQVGPITRTVQDSRLAFEILAGSSAHTPADTDLHGVTVGVVRHFFTRDLQASAIVVEAIDAAIDVLADLGATVVEMELEPVQAYRECGWTILEFEAHATHAAWLRAHDRAYGPETRAALSAGAAVTRRAYEEARLARRRLQRDFADRIRRSGVELLLTAVSPGPAWRRGDRAARASVGDPAMRLAFNVLGVPALALPIGFSPEGLPLSMQLAAAADGEPVLFRAGAAYQAITSWLTTAPPVRTPA
jgi:aspartyl-tRNA(Asn)/glutamyl-tRNA(Gln) amidotransferase subunit A